MVIAKSTLEKDGFVIINNKLLIPYIFKEA